MTVFLLLLLFKSKTNIPLNMFKIPGKFKIIEVLSYANPGVEWMTNSNQLDPKSLHIVLTFFPVLSAPEIKPQLVSHHSHSSLEEQSCPMDSYLQQHRISFLIFKDMIYFFCIPCHEKLYSFQSRLPFTWFQVSLLYFL